MMQHGRWRPVRGLWLALLLLVFSACSSPATPPSDAADSDAPADNAQATDGNVTLNLWIFEGEEGFLPTLKQAFEAKYPNVVLEITEIPEDQYVTKIDTALAANDPPDIGFVYGGQKRWLKAGKFLALDELIAANGINTATFNQNALTSYCLYENKMYCLGSYTGAIMLFYNKDLFDAAGIPYPSATQPMTFDEYAALAAKLSQPNEDITQRVWGASGTGAPYWFMDERAMFSEDGRTVESHLNSEQMVHVFDVLTKMEIDGSAPSATDVATLGDADLLAQSKIAMSITDNIAAIPSLEAQNIRWGAAPTPVVDGAQPWVSTWTDAFGVFSQSDHPEEAKAFIAFLAREGNRLRVETGGAYPLDNAVAEETNWAGDSEGRKEALEVLKLARPGIFVPGYYELLGTPLGDAYTNIVDGNVPPQQALDDAAAQVQDDLDQAWQTWEQIQ
jgi:multiple sugar transport system substrate-binding protein